MVRVYELKDFAVGHATADLTAVVEGDTGVFVVHSSSRLSSAEDIGRELARRFSKRGEKIVVVEAVGDSCYVLTENGSEYLGQFNLEEGNGLMDLFIEAVEKGKKFTGEAT